MKSSHPTGLYSPVWSVLRRRLILALSVAASLMYPLACAEEVRSRSATSADQEADRVRQDYILGPGDELNLTLPNPEAPTQISVIIDPSGYIGVPMIGRIKAEGSTVPQLYQVLDAKFRTYFVHPQITVNVSQFRSQPVSVLGSVNNPGVHQLQGRKNLVEMLSLAGGAKQDASSRVSITRQRQWGSIPLAGSTSDPEGAYYVAQINLDDVISGKRPEQNILIRPYDVISIAKADLVYVVGEVRKPGGFTLREDEKLSVLQALSLAEGMLKTASGGHAKVLRASKDGGKRIEVPVNMGQILSGKQQDIPLLAEDILFIPNSAAKSVLLRTVETGLQIGTGVIIWRR